MGIDPQTHRPLAQHDQSCPSFLNKNAALCNCNCQSNPEDQSTATLGGEDSAPSYNNPPVTASISAAAQEPPPRREAFSYQKLLGMNSNCILEAEDDDPEGDEALKGPPSSPISILSQNSSLTERAYERDHSISSSAAREMTFYELPSLSAISDTATSCCSTKPGELAALSFEVYPVTVDWDSHKAENDAVHHLFSEVNEVHKQEHVSSNSLLLNIINSDGLWDVEIVRPIEDLDSSMIITEAANTDLWESHYTSCVATGL